MKCLLRLFNPVPVALSVARAAHPNLANATDGAFDEGFGVDNNELDTIRGATGAYQCLATLVVRLSRYFYDPVLGQSCHLNSTANVLVRPSSAGDLKRCLGKTVTRIESAATKAASGKSPGKALECFYANWFRSVNSDAPMTEVKAGTLLLGYLRAQRS